MLVIDAERLVIEGSFTAMIAQCPNGQQGLSEPWKKKVVLVVLEAEGMGETGVLCALMR